MNKVIRKISIGTGAKNDAMHYALNQEVYGGHRICDIIFDPNDLTYNVYIQKKDEILPWKKFNPNVGITVEYLLDY